MGDKIKKGALEVLKSPWTATKFVVGTLEKISTTAKIALEDENPDDVKAKKPPSNVATGLLQGTGAIIKGVFSAIVGFFLDPIRGGKKEGFKGAVKGFGKGLIGLVIRPVAGTLDLVTLTARGIANTPKTVYIKLNTVLRKKKRLPKGVVPVTPYLEDGQTHKECVIPIENAEYDMCLDEDELRKQLVDGFCREDKESSGSEKLDDVVTENFDLVVLADIRKKQKRQKTTKKCKLLKVKRELKHFRESLEAALNNLKPEEDIEVLMKEKAKKSAENINGILELDYEGLPTLEPTAINKPNEETEVESIDEFRKEEGVHFQETCREFAVECNLVTVGVDSEEGDQEIVEEYCPPRMQRKVKSSKDCLYSSGSQSLIAFTGNMDKYRKNPMHRAPPRTLLFLC